MKLHLIDRLLSLIGATKLTAIVVLLFTLSVLAMDIFVVHAGYELSRLSMITVSLFGTVSVIGALTAGWLLLTHHGRRKLSRIAEIHVANARLQEDNPLTLERTVKVVFASLALSFASILLSIIIVLWVMGPDVITKYFHNLFIPLIIIVAAVWFPFAKKNVR